MERVPPVKLTIAVNKGVPPPQFTLDPPPPGQKQDTYPPGTYDYQQNKEVTITAPKEIKAVVPRKSGWIFGHWEGDAKGSSPEVTIDTDKKDRIFIMACYTELESLPIKPPPYTIPVMPPPIK